MQRSPNIIPLPTRHTPGATGGQAYVPPGPDRRVLPIRPTTAERRGSVRPIPVEHLRIVDHRVDLYRELIQRQREFEAIPGGPPTWWEIGLSAVCVVALVIFLMAIDGGLI